MCFTLSWVEQILIWLIVVFAVIAILKIIVPMVLSQIGAPGGVIMQIINIALWAFICIMVVIFAFEVIGCLLHAGSFPRLSG